MIYQTNCSEICLRVNTDNLSKEEIKSIKARWHSVFRGSRQGMFFAKDGDLILSGENTIDETEDIAAELNSEYEVYQDSNLAEDCQCANWVTNKIGDEKEYRGYLLQKYEKTKKPKLKKLLDRMILEEL